MAGAHTKASEVPAEFDETRARMVIARLAHLEGALLPILHELSHEFGYVDIRNVPLLAEALNISRADVHGTISFYHDFKTAPQGRHVLKLCRAEACQSMGCESLVAHLAATHHLAPGETTPDRALSVETVYCLGNCALSPAAMLDGELIGRLDHDQLDQIVLDATGMRS
ncbi:MAG: formate dehydrogenase subunit gamma [Hyphomicrobiales bacterium]|nr:formate dehydrogenase subunit gamma [Hyphomicrobiales bacterium]